MQQTMPLASTPIAVSTYFTEATANTSNVTDTIPRTAVATETSLKMNDSSTTTDASSMSVANAAPVNTAVTKQRIAIALWNYDAQEDNELSFEAGDRIIITEFCNADWFEGSLCSAFGFFPANHVKVLPEASSISVLPSSADNLRSGFTSISSDLIPHHSLDLNGVLMSETVLDKDSLTSHSDVNVTPETRVCEFTNTGSLRDLGAESKDTFQSLDLLPEVDREEDTDNDTLEVSRSLGRSTCVEYQSEDNLADDGWHVVTTEDGQKYYWNSATGETSWNAPYGDTPTASFDNLSIHDRPEKVPTVGIQKESLDSSRMVSQSPSRDTASQSVVRENLRITSALAQIETVVPELIRREGWLAYKSRKEFGGVDPKRTHSWHNHWAIVCVGFLIFYKDEPARLKKRSDKGHIGPSLVVTLESITIAREKDSNKKKQTVFTIQTRSGAVWALQPQNESEVNEWVTTISEATREASTAAEYENVTEKLFAHQIPEEVIVEPMFKKRSDDKRLMKHDSKKKERLPIAGDTEDGDSGNKVNIKTKLNAFFKRQQEKGSPIRDTDKKEDSCSDGAIFGGFLEVQVAEEDKSIPSFVERCISTIESRGLNSQGIYRLSGNAATIQRIKTQINQMEPHTELDDDGLDLNAISGLLKLYFRELKDPLFPFLFYDRFIACMKMEDYNERLIEIKNLIQALPKTHYTVLEYLMRHLVRVAAHSETNKMEPSNLAIVFGPTIIRVPSTGNDDMQAAYANMMNMSFQNALVEAIIIQAEWIFDGSPH
ncbi:hypothetical protein O5D80_000514 [Batrachochytrium dendrobatidis]|nr:hypothetical protein O5D80_000514 [Batrachochytrium dendrobatidis]